MGPPKYMDVRRLVAQPLDRPRWQELLEQELKDPDEPEILE